MIFNKHPNLEGRHAILGASTYQWLDYNDEQLVNKYCLFYASTIGTVIHNMCMELILNRIKLRKNDDRLLFFELVRNGIPEIAIDMPYLFPTVAMYVNDAIGFRMTPEVVLKYSDNCFGTTDSICYYDNTLRIHDLKTGKKEAKFDQLLIYAAIFYLEYGLKFYENETILTIYQGGEAKTIVPTPEDIGDVIKIIRASDKKITKLINVGGL